MKFFALIFISLLPFSAFSKTVRYELRIKNERVNLSGFREVDFALTVNGSIPAPTLEFTEGDDAEILIINELEKEETSIHWHGILLPPDQDGVPYVNTPPIRPGQSHLFKFKIRQHGTYWYHSHTMLQEQKGVYGALVIHPKNPKIKVDRDLVLVASDWADENADHILANLKKDGDYYTYKKNSVRSYFGALRQGSSAFKTQLANEWSRMGGMDLSDVGYDAFLINGKRESSLANIKVGERLRLRIINAASSSYFYLAMGLPMKVISSDGVDVEPRLTNEILIGMAETYDVLFTMPDQRSYEVRATAQDVTGKASFWLGNSNEKVWAPDKPQPDLYSDMDHGEHSSSHAADNEHGEHSSNHDDHSAHSDHSAHHGHSEHDHHVKEQAHDAENPALEQMTVDSLVAIDSTELPKSAPVHDLKLVLGGDMERYVWHINGKAINEDRLIEINSGEVVRFTLINETMMHHPIHLHGHFFRVLTEAGAKSPLKHTVDVPPHQTRVIEFYANEPGQWMLHCHNLYHMDTGMARVVRYKDFNLTQAMKTHEKHDPHTHDHIYTYTSLEAASNHAEANFKLMRTWDEIDLKIEAAQDEGEHFSFGGHWEGEGDLLYRRWFGNWLNVFGGATLYHEYGYGTVGVGYILPFLIETAISVNHEGEFKLDIERKFQWTSTLFTEAEFTWRPDWKGEREAEFEVTLMYSPRWHWAAGLMATQKNIGVGAQIQF